MFRFFCYVTSERSNYLYMDRGSGIRRHDDDTGINRHDDLHGNRNYRNMQ